MNEVFFHFEYGSAFAASKLTALQFMATTLNESRKSPIAPRTFFAVFYPEKEMIDI